MYERKTQDCERSWTFRHKSWLLCLLLWCLPGFITYHPPLVTMINASVVPCYREGTRLQPRPLHAGEIWKHRVLVLVWTEKNLKTELFNNDVVPKITWFPCPCFPHTQIQNRPVIVAFLNYSGVVWTEHIWFVFTAKTPFSNSSGAVWRGLPNSTGQWRIQTLS